MIFRYSGRLIGTGFLCALLSISLALGNSALLARGELTSLLTPIAGTMLMAAAILAIATAGLSAIPGQVTTTQEISVVALASVVGATTAAFAGGSSASLLATVLVTIGLTTTLCGLAMLALGKFKLGRLTRFVPYPIFAGFLAMTGWYLITGGIETIIGGHLGLDRMSEFAEPETALKAGFIAAFVATVELLNRRFPSGAILPLSVLLVVGAFNVFVLASGLPHEDLRAAGWLIELPADGISWPPVGVSDLLAVDWGAVGAGMVFAPLVVVITAAAAMMNVSAIELNTGREVDLNVELRSMGIGNVAAGLVGGIPGFPAVSATLLALRSGAPYRAIGLVAGLLAGCALIFAPQLLSLVPLPMLGAVLIWVGVSLTINWLVHPSRTLRRSEYAIVLAILGVSVAAGLPAGIVTGLLAAVVLFTVEYTRVDVIRYVASGRDLHSRSLSEERRSQMASRGDAVSVFKLAGFIFFGTSDSILQRIVARVEASGASRPWYAILDFSQVTGLDSSAAMTFARLRRTAERRHFQVVFAGLGPFAQRLIDSGLNLTLAPFHNRENLDTALRWVEDEILGAELETQHRRVEVEVTLGRLLGSQSHANAIGDYLTRVDFGAGERLIQQGLQADDVYLVEFGRGSVILESASGEAVEVMGFGPGAILGEVAFYGLGSRSASALALEPGVAWKLTREAVARLEQDQPLAAAALHRAMAGVLAERLQSTNRLIRDMAH